jgi:hypothetical protein
VVIVVTLEALVNPNLERILSSIFLFSHLAKFSLRDSSPHFRRLRVGGQISKIHHKKELTTGSHDGKKWIILP